jgi:hypothetical protein
MAVIINGSNTPTAGAVAVGDGTTLNFTAAGTAGQILSSNGASVPTWINNDAGTVTNASVVSANGFAGTIATSSTTPAITLTTSITGLVKGNGTAISAAVAGTDYIAPPAGTALLKANSGGALANATAGTDYVTPTGTETLTNKTLTSPTVTDYIETVVAIGTVTTASTISLASGTVQTATLTASTACTFTMPTATAGKSFVLLLKQAASTGSGTATFTGVKWNTASAPTITATAGKMDILTFIADGTNWYGSIAQGYTP